jgi:hypothetical protein
MENLLDLETYRNVQSAANEIGHFYLDFFLTGFCAFFICGRDPALYASKGEEADGQRGQDAVGTGGRSK